MSEKILLVEDSRTQAEALRALLSDAGYEVSLAYSTEAALEEVGRGAIFDLVLSDIVMPGRSGFELSKSLKETLGAESPPVILLTTLSDPTDIVRGLESRADNYVTKPYAPDLLLQRIRQVLDARGRRSARDEAPGGAIDVQFMGSTFRIEAGRGQILDMLLSSFEELIRATNELQQSQEELRQLHIRAEDRADRLARLQQVTEALAGARTPKEVVDTVLTVATRAFGAAGGSAALSTEDGVALEVVQTVGDANGALSGGAGRVALDTDHLLARAARTRQLVIDAPEVGGSGPAADRPSALAAPLVLDDKVQGAWALSFRKDRSFEEVDEQFFLTLTRQFAQSLDRAQLFEAEQRARAEAEEANRAKAQFLAAMSHDLRTPLNAIAGYVDLIDLGIRGPVTDAQRADLARIKRSQEFLLSLINDVLNFAKLEAGSVVYHLAPVPIAPLLEDLDAMLRPQMEANQLSYRWKLDDPATTVVADEEKLQQVLLNLGGNALKFTPSGGSVTVECEKAGGEVAIHVRDTGVGIPAQGMAAIFDPFVQAHPTLPRTKEGIGLGLAISNELVRGMGGTLTVESELGVGSTFTLKLPLPERWTGEHPRPEEGEG